MLSIRLPGLRNLPSFLEATMADLPKLNESDVQRWISEPSFGRGHTYYRQGHILNPRRQGEVIKGRCLGSQPRPYELSIRLGADGIASGMCSCPVGGGGRCKHAAALLLTWVHEPEAFAEVEALDAELERRSKAELIALVRRMVERYPDLEMLVELPTAGGQAQVNAEAIRRQANAAFYGVGYDDWGAAYGITQTLKSLVDLGDDYLEQQGWRNAAVVYQPVIEAVLEHYGYVEDEGELASVVNDCVAGLGQCLQAAADSAFREMLLSALFGVYRWDVDFGGIDMGYEAIDFILDEATAEEKTQVAEWVRGALPVGQDWSSNYHRQAYGGFLIALEADHLDDESYLRLCRETSRWSDLVDRLLALGRVDEAVEVAQQVGDYDLLSLANLFVTHDQGDLARQVVGERAKTSTDSRLLGWLKEDAQKHGDAAAALGYAETLFWMRPSVPAYVEVRDLAQPLGRWDALRASILARLRDESQSALLTGIYLADDEIDLALSSLAEVRSSRWAWHSANLSIQAAQAAEETRPRESIRLYVEQAQQLIDARGRGNYQTAAGYLARVRDLFDKLGEPETWRGLIAKLRERERRLRALQDELNKAGL
jgi:uncharacterized Zn finger protein